LGHHDPEVCLGVFGDHNTAGHRQVERILQPITTVA